MLLEFRVFGLPVGNIDQGGKWSGRSNWYQVRLMREYNH